AAHRPCPPDRAPPTPSSRTAFPPFRRPAEARFDRHPRFPPRPRNLPPTRRARTARSLPTPARWAQKADAWSYPPHRLRFVGAPLGPPTKTAHRGFVALVGGRFFANMPGSAGNLGCLSARLGLLRGTGT